MWRLCDEGGGGDPVNRGGDGLEGSDEMTGCGLSSPWISAV